MRIEEQYSLRMMGSSSSSRSIGGGDRQHQHRQSSDANPRANALRMLQKLRMKRERKAAEAVGDDHQCRANSSNAPINPRSSSPQTQFPPIPPTVSDLEMNATTTMQFLFEKKLRHSDVKPEGRIIIPKGFAEKYMPSLESSCGIYMFMDDVGADKVWMFKYRFWQNHASRVYVLESTGELIRAGGLGAGDFIMIYRDKETQRYGIGVRKNDGGGTDEVRMISPTSTSKSGTKISEKRSTTTTTKRRNNKYKYYFWGSSQAQVRGEGGISSISSSSTASYDISSSRTNGRRFSEYSHGLRGFPFHLLHKVQISDLPDY